MNSAAISILAESGIQGRDAEIMLRRLLSTLVTPTRTAREVIESLGLDPAALDPSLRSIPEIVRLLTDAGLDEPAAVSIFGEEGAPAMLALTRQVRRLEALQGA